MSQVEVVLIWYIDGGDPEEGKSWFIEGRTAVNSLTWEI